MIPATVAWVPVVDISRHQGRVDFVKMRNAGIQGLILRVSHGLTLDVMAEEYWTYAMDAGYEAADIGFYPFINPKRGSAQATARFAVEAIEMIRGDLDFLYMLDVENYRNESPNPGLAPVYGPAFADYIREHIATVKSMAPKSRVIGYSNRAYWNGKVAGTEWVGDDALAASLEWIIARYPVYSLAAYAVKPVPRSPALWAEWAFKVAPDGPFPPRGATGWEGWQFSAGFNRQGPVYGASSSDLDLNIVHPEAWARWTAKTGPTPPPFPPPPDPPQEIETMPYVIFELVDSKAAFWGQANRVGGPVLAVRWSGPGSTTWLARRAQMVAEATTEVRQAAVGNLATMDLEGALPDGDPDHVWVGDEFANQEEIITRNAPTSAVDEQAREGVAFCRAELATQAAQIDATALRDERDRALFVALGTD